MAVEQCGLGLKLRLVGAQWTLNCIQLDYEIGHIDVWEIQFIMKGHTNLGEIQFMSQPQDETDAERVWQEHNVQLHIALASISARLPILYIGPN